MSTPTWLEEIDHTGDTGILVRAGNLTTLFERTAWAMFTILTDVGTVSEKTVRALEIDATDRDDLLVRWLSDLNYIHLTEGMLFCRFNVREMTDDHLSADVWGEPIDRERHTVFTEVKAVTYHGLHIRGSDGEWSAQVIFDM